MNPIERNVALGILAGEIAREAVAAVTGLLSRDEDKPLEDALGRSNA